MRIWDLSEMYVFIIKVKCVLDFLQPLKEGRVSLASCDVNPYVAESHCFW